MHRQKFPAIILISLLALAVVGCTEVKTISESEIIPFKTVKNRDASLFEGETKVVQPGEQGLRTVVYEETYKWGKKGGRKKIKVETVYQPSGEIVNVGTRKALTITVQNAAGDFEPNISAASWQPTYINGRVKITDAAVIKGTIKNVVARPPRTGRSTDLALMHPSLKGGVIFLPSSPAGTVGPGQILDVVWAGNEVKRAIETAIAEKSLTSGRTSKEASGRSCAAASFRARPQRVI